MSRILIIRGGAVGDFILTLPAIQLLRDQLPGPEIEILGYEGIASLAVHAGFATSVRSLESARLAPFFVPNGPLDPPIKAYFNQFHLVVSYLFDPDEIFAGNLRRSGVTTLLTGNPRVDEARDIPAARQLAEALEPIALYLEQPWVEFPVPTTPPAPSSPSPRIAIHPGSGGARKNWSLASWAAVLEKLHHHFPLARFLIISGEAERQTIPAFLDLIRPLSLPFDHAACRPLPEVALELASCDLFLGHDSGISHLAAAAGAPCLLLFGPTKPRIWAPQNPGVEVLSSPSTQVAGIDQATVITRATNLLAKF